MKSSMNDVLDKVEQINKVGVIGLVAPASSRPGASATTYVPLLIHDNQEADH
jgi:hypothetical protein